MSPVHCHAFHDRQFSGNVLIYFSEELTLHYNAELWLIIMKYRAQFKKQSSKSFPQIQAMEIK